MAVAAHLYPDIVHPDVFTEPFSPEEVCCSFVHGNNVFVLNHRTDPFLFSPNRTSVGPDLFPVPSVKNFFPLLPGFFSKLVHVVDNLEEVITFFAPVDYFIKLICFTAFFIYTAKPGSIFTHG